MKAGSKSP